MNRVRAGTIFYVDDPAIVLPGGEARQYHDQRRPVLIVSDQNDVHGTNTQDSDQWPSVLAVPISSSTTYKTRFDVRLPAGCGNLPKKGWARVPAVQPIDKDYLGDHLGVVPEQVLEDVTAKLLDYLGILEPEVEEDEE